ncbi:hypothetical protein SFMTTN_1614 [Sulfuriferula multivorans]|uniref:Uncharacterized protein n=1 Tax=Sulfuriferula multivorans TaxID=1559896 RepID=A0A401JDT2_9PROT|nr:hypothetical protein SFMTTN_1614 [Sulfuriferula multivorans]
MRCLFLTAATENKRHKQKKEMNWMPADHIASSNIPTRESLPQVYSGQTRIVFLLSE